MKRLLITFVTMLLSTQLYSRSAVATIIDNGSYTTDTLTELDWLDVNLSVNKSYDGMIMLMQPGHEFAGWRYATRIEVTDLFSHALGVQIPYYTTAFFSTNTMDNIVPILGISGFRSWQRASAGLTSDLSQDQVYAVAAMDNYSGSDYLEGSSGYHMSRGLQNPEIGSWLVRASVSSVPAPGTCLLISPGLIWLLWKRPGSRKERETALSCAPIKMPN